MVSAASPGQRKSRANWVGHMSNHTDSGPHRFKRNHDLFGFFSPDSYSVRVAPAKHTMAQKVAQLQTGIPKKVRDIVKPDPPQHL